MKWILAGKNDAAVACLEYLVARGDEVLVLGVRNDTGADGWQRSLQAAAQRLGVPFEQPARINAPQVVDRLAAYAARALISIQYDQILREPLFRNIGCPCLNLHFALLPRHRGVAPIAWAVACGDEEAGVTLHHMIEDIDAGDVLAQRSVPVGAGDSAREVYDRVSDAAEELFVASYPFPDPLLTKRLSQDGRAASYHKAGDFDFSQLQVAWARPAEELQRWLRAMIFPPLQYPETRLGSRRLAIARVSGTLGDATAASPGCVVAVSPDGVDVAATGGTLRLQEIFDAEAPQASAALASLALGDQLG